MATGTSTSHWQMSTTTINERLEILRTRGHFHDVRFRVEVYRPDGTGIDVQHFNAHKVLLASASPVFARTLYENELLETVSSIDVRVTDVPHKAFELMLRYIYNHPVDFDSPLLALQTYKAAKKYEIKHLKDLVVDYFQSCILQPLDVIQILDDDSYTEIRGLHQRCLDIAESKPLESIRLAAEKSKDKTINLLLQMERISISSELALLKELVTGLKCRKIERASDRSHDRLIRQFLPNIRFLTMTPQEFSISLCICGDAIQQHEGYAILKLLSHPESGNFPIPTWCCKLTRLRMCQARNVMELDLLPPYMAYGDYATLTEEAQTKISLINALEIKVHGGRFVFTGVVLVYRRVVPEFQQLSEDSTPVPVVRCTLNIRNNSSGVAYERVVNLQLDGRSTILQFPVPLPVAAREEGKVSVILDGDIPVEFSRYTMKRHMAGNEAEGFQVQLDNYRTNDNTFAISKIYYA